MPNPKQHQEKAEHNRAFLGTIADDAYSDWRATTAFYVAVHLVEKLRAYDGDHSQDHSERDRYVRRNHRAIYDSYRQLYSASLEARYKSLHAFSIPPADVTGVLIDVFLVEIERHVALETTARTAGS